jgi:hypothetical protein
LFGIIILLILADLAVSESEVTGLSELGMVSIAGLSEDFSVELHLNFNGILVALSTGAIFVTIFDIDFLEGSLCWDWLEGSAELDFTVGFSMSVDSSCASRSSPYFGQFLFVRMCPSWFINEIITIKIYKKAWSAKTFALLKNIVLIDIQLF